MRWSQNEHPNFGVDQEGKLKKTVQGNVVIFPLYKPSFSLVQTIPCLSVQPFGKHNLEATRFLSLHPPSIFWGEYISLETSDSRLLGQI